MIKYIKLRFLLPLIILTFLLVSCQDAGVNSTGSEYMPEMSHSIAFEANTYAYYPRNTFGSEKDYHLYVQPRQPVEGTVPRGSVLDEMPQYYYGNSEEERARAMAEIVDNPIPISEKSLSKGEELFTIYCAICHGVNGDSKGYLVRDDGGKYLALPANLMSDEFISASNGRYYHALMRGRNVMASYADKLDHEERWSVIQYIRSMQAEIKGAEYNHLVNTLNTTDKPAGDASEIEIDRIEDKEEPTGESHGDKELH
jgi:mono/diheme cytochrome c family protein